MSRSFLLNEKVVFDTLSDRLILINDQVVTVRLKPVAARILLEFVANPKRLLRRQELLDAGWRQYGMEVCDNSLNQVVHSIRHSFEHIDPAGVYIKTIPRIGYAFIASVSARETSAIHTQ